MRPPALANALLSLAASDAEAEAITGDLIEEYSLVIAAEGARAARNWFWSQVARSVPALIRMRWHTGELPSALLIALLLVAMPLLALDRMWAFVFSQVPLKVDLVRPADVLTVNLLCALVLGHAGGRVARSLGGIRSTVALAGMCAVAGALTSVVAPVRPALWYLAALTAALGISVIAAVPGTKGKRQ